MSALHNPTRFNDQDYIKAMGMVLYCSGDLTDSMVDYLYANGLFLGGGDHVILLFSSNDEYANNAADHFRKYEKVMDAVEAEFNGVLMNYPLEYDGRLCVLLSLRKSLIDAAPFYSNIELRCRRIISVCKDKYRLNVAVYISSLAKSIGEISRKYEKTLIEMEYCNFLGKPLGINISSSETANRTDEIISIIDYGNAVAETLCGKIVSNGDYTIVARQVLDKLLNIYPHDKSTLRNNYTKISEQIYLKLIERRILLPGVLSMADFADNYLVVTNWQECEKKFLGFLNFVHERYHSADNTDRSDMARVLAYISEQYPDSNLNVETIAEHFLFKPSTLCTSFKKEYGETMFSYITKLRLDKAMELLNTTDMPITKIYEQSGFGSVETMNRLFKKRFGTSPGKYRINIKKSSL